MEVIRVQTAEDNISEDAIEEFRQFIEDLKSRRDVRLQTLIDLKKEMEDLEREKNLLNSDFEEFKLQIEKIAPRREELIQRKLNYSQVFDISFDQEMDALSLECNAIKPMVEKIKLWRYKLAELAYFKSLREIPCERLISRLEDQISEYTLMLNDLQH